MMGFTFAISGRRSLPQGHTVKNQGDGESEGTFGKVGHARKWTMGFCRVEKLLQPLCEVFDMRTSEVKPRQNIDGQIQVL